MTVVNPFRALRPYHELTEMIAALPYDVYNRSEAKAIVQANPFSFLQIDRGETLLSDSINTYDPLVYEAASAKLQSMIEAGQFVADDKESYYIYELERLGRVQRGIVGLVQAKEYEAGIIKKHENTREVKEQDRITHIDVLKAHTGPIYLTYKNNQHLQAMFESVLNETEVIFEFTSEDDIRHKGYKITEANAIRQIKQLTEDIDILYIADGHHRAASAAKVAKKYNYQGESAQFLAVMFPDNELRIMDYNRVVTDLNGLSTESFLDAILNNFEVVSKGATQVSPKEKSTFGMFLDQQWYELTFKQVDQLPKDPVSQLDVSILQDYLLKPILGIDDPRTSERIDFVGGIRGLVELETRVSNDMKIAFSMKPTTIDELIQVSDAGLLMPPKSTWFEPKLKSGLFIHTI